MKHANISIFIPHKGCPNLCSFCNQRTISGEITEVSALDVEGTLLEACPKLASPSETEIAFFGGSFTAIPFDYMISLLEVGKRFVDEFNLHGIRISTRPDCISCEILDVLKKYGVTAIELGAQSMCDEVLSANFRGHSSDDVRNSAKLIKQYGFELGLQMMIGLYNSKIRDDFYTANEIVKLRPDTVRIYPTVILQGTKLAEYFSCGKYISYNFSDAVSLTSEIMEIFHSKKINIIRVGLHSSENFKSEAVGGFFHPAFRELCETEIYKKKLEKLDLKSGNKYEIHVPLKEISKAVGQKKSNVNYFLQKNVEIKFIADEAVKTADEMYIYVDII